MHRPSLLNCRCYFNFFFFWISMVKIQTAFVFLSAYHTRMKRTIFFQPHFYFVFVSSVLCCSSTFVFLIVFSVCFSLIRHIPSFLGVAQWFYPPLSLSLRTCRSGPLSAAYAIGPHPNADHYVSTWALRSEATQRSLDINFATQGGVPCFRPSTVSNSMGGAYFFPRHSLRN